MLLSQTNATRLYTSLLCAVAATLPFSITLSSTATILLVLTWLLEGQWEARWQLAKQNTWVPFFLLLFLLHVVGLLYTSDMKAGLFDLEKKLSLFLFPLILGTTLTQKNLSRQQVLNVFIVSCSLVAVYCIGAALYRYWNHIPPATSVYGGFKATQAFKSEHAGASALWEYITYSELSSPLRLHPTYLSMYVVLIVLHLYLNLLGRVDRSSKATSRWWLQLMLFFFFSAFLFLLSSRIMLLVYIGLICLISFIRLYNSGSRVKLTLGVASFVVLLGVVGASVPVVRHRFLSDLSMIGKEKQDASPGTGMYTRLMYWQAASHTMLQHPLGGTGTGDLQGKLDNYYEEHAMDAIGMNAHSQYLQTGAMLGIPAMAYLFLLVLLPLVIAWKRADMLYVSFLLLIGAAFFTEAILQANKGIVFYALFNALFFFIRKD